MLTDMKRLYYDTLFSHIAQPKLGRFSLNWIIKMFFFFFFYIKLIQFYG